tara:strand:- start:233 stop:781 length:549 start_codon:yes stop_codon:yes gene_type:complete
MRPLFTVHAGEFIAGDYIGREFRYVDVWVPAKDRGIDLLVTNKKCKKAVSLQVKFSRDYLFTDISAEFQKPLRACGWWTLDRSKIVESPADYWIFVLAGFARRTTDFVIIKPSVLLKRLDKIHRQTAKIQSYLWVTKAGKCWETRGLKKTDKQAIAQGTFSDRTRDFTAFHKNWQPIEKLKG